ncbi:MAG: response regulator [Acidobacteriaceae bacterium]|nr:response regulator [Acidobacteriaceae bacterium]
MIVGLPCAAASEHVNGLIKPPVVEKQDIRFSRVTLNGESLQSRITNIAQDNYGFLWLGTSDGLYKYDGYSLTPYRHQPGNSNTVGDDLIIAIYEDRDGSLWIGTKAGGLDRLDPSRNTVTHFRHQPNNPKSLANDLVQCIYRDRSGNLWVGTFDGLDRLEPATGTFVHYRHDSLDNGSLSGNDIICIYEDRRQNLWVGTTTGLNRLDRATSRFKGFLHDPKNPRSISHDYVTSVLEDHSGALWVASPMGSGLSALDVETGEFTHYSFHTEEPSAQSVAGVQGLFEDRDGRIWLSTIDRGLLRFDRERKTLTRYAHEPGNANSLPSDTVYTVFADAEGEMWVGTQNGFGRFQPGPPSFVDYKHEPGNPNSLHNDMIWSVQADNEGSLWIGDEDGLNRFDARTGQYSFYQHNRRNPFSLSYNKVAAIREDRLGTMWFGTYGGGLARFDRKTGRFFTYRHDPKDPGSLSSDSVVSLLIDERGTLWVGTQGGGLDRFDARTGRFTTYLNDVPDTDSSLPVLFEDHAGMLWAGTPGRGLIRFDAATHQFTSYRHNPEDAQSLSNDKITAVREDRRGRLWIGTHNGLNLIAEGGGSFTVFTRNEGLPDNDIESILEDRHGYLWLGTHNGISRFDPDGRTFHNYSESDGLAGNLEDPYGPEGSCQTADGKMVFGSSNGVTVFDPDRIFENHYVPSVVLTDFLLFNQPVREGKESPLKRSIWATDSLMLTHRQSIFTLEFAALSYMAPEMNRYRYRLEGFERQWNEVDSGRRSATYTNLPAGKYTFKVQGSNNAGVWNTKGIALAITVLPPWWGTWWFRTLAGIIIAGLILAIYRSRVKHLELQAARLEMQVLQRTHELELAKNAAEEARKAAELANQAKSTFLANMSHELRTPLNAILGFSNLLRDNAVSEKQRKDLETINRSGEHLLTLINEVLDMAKIDSGRVAIENAPIDAGELVNGVADLMRLRAEEKGLELLVMRAPEFWPFLEADGQKLREVLLNLIGNAVKFTEDGWVSVRGGTQPAEDPQYCRLVLEVQDTGIGIAAGEQTRIFDPFVQAGRLARQKGTGLGLAITKRYVELMGGTIQVESTPGRGSLFRVEIPVRKLDAWDMPAAAVHRGGIIGLEPGQPAYRVLIIEDQEENWLLLQRLLEDAGFQVQVAMDGATGIERFLAWRPHFIWMDWRLPGMDGTEAARRIRELDGGRNVKISMLSAFAFAEYRAQALAAGVDDYVSKPFRAEDIFDCLARHLGVRYTYRAAAAGEPPSLLNPQILARLPATLRKQLAEAVISLDIDGIAHVISRITEQDPAVGSILSNCADRYAYSSILQALQSLEAVQA